MFEQCKIDPWFQLFAKQRMAEREHKHELGLNNSQTVMEGIRKNVRNTLVAIWN